MSKLTILGSGCFLLLCAGIFAAIRFPIGCLFVPCDRSVRFVLQPQEQDLGGCELLLFAPGDKALSEPLRRLVIQDHEAEVIVQPRWTEAFLVALDCKGLRLSDPQLVDYSHKESVTLQVQKPGA
jgi:hypothetical protein